MDKMNKLKEKFQELIFISEGKLDPQDQTLNKLLLIHAYNVCNNLECIGLSEDDNEKEEEQILPEKWNIGDEGVYSFKYKTQSKDKKVYIFKIIFDGDQVNINAISVQDSSKLYSSTIQLDQFNLVQIEKNESVFEQYSKDILNHIVENNNQKQNNPSSSQSQSQNQRINQEQYYPNLSLNQPQRNQNYFDPMRDYGRSDIHPNFGNPFGQNSNNPFINPSGRNFNPRFDPLGPQGISGIPDDIQPDFYPNNNQGPYRGGNGRGPIGGPFGGGMGGGFGGMGGGFGGMGGGFGGGFV